MAINDVRKCYIRDEVDLKQATKELTKKYMAETGWDKYYEHAIQITSAISKKTPEWAKDEEQERLDLRFMEAKIAW